MKTGGPKPYHHGDLRQALLDAVDAAVREQGLEALTLRGVARRVGVSHPAAFRHFADKRALLTAFAARSAERMAGFIADAIAASAPADRFLAAGTGYIRFAMEQPGAFRAVFRAELIDPDDPEYRHGMSLLAAPLADAGAPKDADAPLPSEALLAWGAAHGLASLYVDGALERDLPAGSELQAMAGALALIGRSRRNRAQEK